MEAEGGQNELRRDRYTKKFFALDFAFILIRKKTPTSISGR